MLLFDALRSETYRLSKNRVALFWSIVFWPLFALVAGIAGNFFVHQKAAGLTDKLPPELMAGGPLNLGQTLIDTAARLDNPVTLLFILIGAATLFAGDYRWETWRLISARNTRPNLLTAKVGVLKGLVLVMVIGLMVVGVLTDVSKAMIFERPLVFSMDGADWARAGMLFVLNFVRIVQFAMIGLLTAVATRSLLATLFVPMVVAIAQFILMQSLPMLGLAPDGWIALLLIPGLDVDTLRGVIQNGGDGPVVRSLIGLLLWAVAPFLIALAWFQRQDLSKE